MLFIWELIRGFPKTEGRMNPPPPSLSKLFKISSNFTPLFCRFHSSACCFHLWVEKWNWKIEMKKYHKYAAQENEKFFNYTASNIRLLNVSHSLANGCWARWSPKGAEATAAILLLVEMSFHSGFISDYNFLLLSYRTRRDLWRNNLLLELSLQKTLVTTIMLATFQQQTIVNITSCF